MEPREIETMHPFLTGKLQAAWPEALVFELPGEIRRFVARRDGQPDFYLAPLPDLSKPDRSLAEINSRSFIAARRSIACIVAATRAANPKPKEDPDHASK